MTSLKGKKIVLGVTGSIAAYKAALLVRLLVKEEAEVRVIMTEAALGFITPLTLATLSKNPVISSFTAGDSGLWNNHVELGIWADVLVIAPATAHTLSKCATGNCDDLLTAVYLSAKCKVFFAPAMDLDMYHHPSTVENLQKLQGYGNHIIPSGHGELASGLIGDGRMAEPEQIVQSLSRHFAKVPATRGKRVLITAGPTQEAIDPVRYISNHSSGKMGYAIGEAFAAAGAKVTIVSGPVHLTAKDEQIRIISVKSAEQMFRETEALFTESDLIIFAAAVADYSPVEVADQKIKKKDGHLHLELKQTTDIAGTLSPTKRENQIVMGFALETENEEKHAVDKLIRKNFDYIVLNSLNDPGAGFAHDTNKITVIDKNKTMQKFPTKSKEEVAQDLLKIIISQWSQA